MKPALLIILATLLFSIQSCHKKLVIALQPLNSDGTSYNDIELDSLQARLTAFYNTPVLILKPINIPQTFFNTRLQEFSADSIISLLSALPNAKTSEIVAVTRSALYTIKEDKRHTPYIDEYIFGFGYLPGTSCVISGHRLQTYNDAASRNRLRNVVIHEIGHNMGLQHCTNRACIMSEETGRPSALDKPGLDYCAECKRKLKQMHASFGQ